MLVCFAPSRMSVKISPSLVPCFHSLSVKSEGLGLSETADLPSPLPDSPWQEEQLDAKSFRPVATDAPSDATGFFNVGELACCAPGRAAPIISRDMAIVLVSHAAGPILCA